MVDYEEQTESLLEIGESPLLFAIGEDDEKYFKWLLDNDVGIPRNILEQILNNGWPSKYIPLLLNVKSPKYFDNPLKSAILAENDEIIRLLIDKGFPIDTNVVLAVIDEDNIKLLEKILPKYPGDINLLYSTALTRGAPNTVKYLASKGAVSLKTKEEEECDKDEEGNIIDPFTVEPIPRERLVSIKEGAKVYCFDLDSLYKNYRGSGKLINPFTNKEFPAELVKKIRDYGERNKTTVRFVSPLKPGLEPRELVMDRDAELGQVLFDFNEKVSEPYMRGRQNLGNFMLNVKIDGKNHRLSEYDLTTPMNTLNFGGPFVFTVQDLQLDPYRRVKIGELYPRIYKYASGKNIPWAETNLIPDIYHGDPPAQDQPGANDLREFTEILVDLDDPTGIADFVVNQEQLKILAEDVPILEEFIDSKFKGNDNRYLKHLLYSRVVDKQNLKARGIEASYMRNLYEQPDYRILYNQP